MKLDYVVSGCIVHDEKILLIFNKKLGLWLPPGGHIEEGETPDDALHREVKEEVGLDIEIHTQSKIPVAGLASKNLAIPFYTNVHRAIDHDHCCFFYLCKPLDMKILINEDEIGGYRWFSSEELSETIVPEDVKHIGREAICLSKELF